MTYEFGDFELDPTRRVLLSRDGQPADITGRVMDALIYLVERPGQLIEKKALIDAVWPNVVVEEGNLSQTIHTLRRVLGEKAGEHRYIATVPGRGYQFVAEVKERAAAVVSPVAPVPTPTPEPVPTPAPTRRPIWVLATVGLALVVLVVLAMFMAHGRDEPAEPVAVAATAHPSIAVLPFVDMSTAQDQAHFADGLSEEILNILAHADNLRVIARTSSFSFRDENADIKTIARRLDVSHVLEGSVRKEGNRLRIVAQLIDASNSAHVWSDSYDREERDIFGVQREIASAVADALRVKLARAEPRRAETTSTEAYEHYLEGRLLFNRRSGNDVAQSVVHFEKAVQLDPAYGRAWAGLAGAYFIGHYEKVVIPNVKEKWGMAAERAVALAPDLAEAHVRLAQYLMHVGKFKEAQRHFDRAKVLDPEDPMVLSISLSDALYYGRMEEALAFQRRMVAVDPLSASQRSNLGNLLTMFERLPEAQAELERALELSPAGVSTLQGVADVLILQGRADDAPDVIARMPDGYLRDSRMALVQYARGNVHEGDEILSHLQALAVKPGADNAIALSVAEIHARRGDADRAYEWLERAGARAPSPADPYPRWDMREMIQTMPFLKPLHADPRWDELLAKLDQ